MWSLIARIVARLAVIRWIMKIFGGLGLLIPIAFVLKLVGIPILMVLGVLALPVLVALFLFGLPVFLVVVVGGVLMAALAPLLMLGVALLKLVVMIALPVWAVIIVVKMVRRMMRGGGNSWRNSDEDGDAGAGRTADVHPPTAGAGAGNIPPE